MRSAAKQVTEVFLASYKGRTQITNRYFADILYGKLILKGRNS